MITPTPSQPSLPTNPFYALTHLIADYTTLTHEWLAPFWKSAEHYHPTQNRIVGGEITANALLITISRMQTKAITLFQELGRLPPSFESINAKNSAASLLHHLVYQESRLFEWLSNPTSSIQLPDQQVPSTQ